MNPSAGNTPNAFIPLSVPNFAGNEKQYVTDAVVSEWVSSGGARVGEFEEKLAAYVGMPRAVACASGTAGLHLAMLVAGVRPGDEVIAPALTFIAAINPICYAGACPVFIGCDDSLCIDPAAVEAFCQNECTMQNGQLVNNTTGRVVRALEVVHVFGNLCDIERLHKTCRKYNLRLIEDATEALGSRYNYGLYTGRMAGTVGDVGVYSFNGNKIITTGSGGMLVSRRDEWANRAKHLSTQAKTDEVHYLHDEIGYNYRMTNLQAALGVAQLEQLDGFIAHKKAMYQAYVQRLDGAKGLRMLPFRAETAPNYWFYSLYLTDAYPLGQEELMARLREDNIQTRTIWGLICDQAPYRQCQAFAMQAAREYCARVVNLPCSTSLTAAQQQRVCDAILSYAE